MGGKKERALETAPSLGTGGMGPWAKGDEEGTDLILNSGTGFDPLLNGMIKSSVRSLSLLLLLDS